MQESTVQENSDMNSMKLGNMLQRKWKLKSKIDMHETEKCKGFVAKT